MVENRALGPALIAKISKKNLDRVAEVLMVGFGVLLLSLSAQIQIPLPFTPVPLTGQTLAVLLIGATYGSVRGALTVLSYLLVGSLGAPVFAGGAAGILKLMGPTGGYLIGFVFAAFLMGALAERGWDRKFRSGWPLFFIGHTVVFFFGVLWLAQMIGLEAALVQGYMPFIAGEVIKTTLAAAVLPWARKLL